MDEKHYGLITVKFDERQKRIIKGTETLHNLAPLSLNEAQTMLSKFSIYPGRVIMIHDLNNTLGV